MEIDKLNSLKHTIQQAQTKMSDLDLDQSPFSDAAFNELQTKIAEHIQDLFLESIKVSKHHKADSVSAADVIRASENLIARQPNRVYKHLGTIGGIVLGTGLSEIYSMATESSFTTFAVLLSTVSAIIGTFLVALHMAKD